MRELKRFLLVALALSFVGGFGMGSWVGTVVATPRSAPSSVELRARDYQEILDLSVSQTRQVQERLWMYDTEVRLARSRNAHTLEIEQITESWRQRIVEDVLTDEQRRKYENGRLTDEQRRKDEDGR